jgi:predicted DsbA family dithiol-disulfide isomerase
MDSNRPELKITVFSDFICPFCYIGHRRVERLRDAYDLKINWRFLEIHPETPAGGGKFDDYGIPDARRKMLESALEEMATLEGLEFRPRERVSNSNKALRLAEAAKGDGTEVFYPLCEGLFKAYFAEDQDIGDEDVLRRLARHVGMAEGLVDAAWHEERFQAQLMQNLQSAIELGVTGTPTFFFGPTRLTGAVPVETLRAAASAQLHAADTAGG